jgi:hypothetical protein
LPVTAAEGVTRREAEALKDKLLVKLFDLEPFKLVERTDLRQVLEEKNVSATEGFDAEKSARIASLLGAEVVILPRLSRGPEKLELLVKMVRVETGEILALSLMKLDGWLI